MKSVDVAVVGGGLAALIAANDTARMGLATSLFEAAPTLGGRAQTRILDGFHFNLGPHALYMNGQFRKALSALDVNVAGHRLQLTKAVALWEGQQHPLPLGETCPAQRFERIGRSGPDVARDAEKCR